MDKLSLKLGRRGAALLLFGFVWIVISYSFIVGRLGTAPDGIMAFVPGWAIGIGWIVTGIYAIASAFGTRHDWGGFVALMIMPLIRAAAFLWAWLAYLISGGAAGYGDGFAQATLYGLISALIYMIAGWPEPLRLPDPGANTTAEERGGDNE